MNYTKNASCAFFVVHVIGHDLPNNSDQHNHMQDNHYSQEQKVYITGHKFQKLELSATILHT